jgi:hypothetical protein
VPELDQAVGYIRRIKTEVFGIEAFATAPVTDGGCDKNSTAAYGVEEGGLGLVGWIHVFDR